MANTELTPIPADFKNCIEKYNWWWRFSHSINKEEYLETLLWIEKPQAPYIYELYKRKTGKYYFGEKWLRLSFDKQLALASFLNGESKTNRLLGRLKAYQQISDYLLELLVEHLSRWNGVLDNVKDLSSIATDVSKELDSRVDALVKHEINEGTGLWSSVNLESYNLNKSDHSLIKEFKDWLAHERQQLGIDKRKRSNDQNAVKLWPRIEAYDLIHFQKIPMGQLPAHWRHNFKSAQEDFKKLEAFPWSKIEAIIKKLAKLHEPNSD